MAEVGPIINGGTSVYRNKDVPTAQRNGTMSISDFYTLLAAQMKYQDADNPMDTSEMMASMVQTQMIEAITQMTSMSTTTYLASMAGKEVTIAEVDADGNYTGDKVGVVTGVVLGNNPIVFVDGKAYATSQIVAIGKVPENPKNPDDTGEPKDPEVGGNTNTGDEGDK